MINYSSYEARDNVDCDLEIDGDANCIRRVESGWWLIAVGNR